MNFELLPILTDYANQKKGDEILKKSSLKPLSQSQPNFAEMILGWSPFKIVSPECLQMTTFKIVFTLDVFFSAETTMHCKVFYIRNRHISVSSFVYKYDQ